MSSLVLRNTLLCLFQKPQNLEQCMQIHSFMITSGISGDTFFISKFLQGIALSQTPCFPYALILLNTIHNPNTRLLNTIIKAFSMSSAPQLTFSCYARMRQKGVDPDKHTFPLLLKRVSKSNNLDPFLVYAQIIRYELDFDRFVRNALISCFANLGLVECACKVFDESPSKDVVAWTALIDGYVKNDSPAEALRCFARMRTTGMRVDGLTIVSILCAAGLLGVILFGKWVHGFYLEAGRVQLDVYVCSALVDMYFKCGQYKDARKAFDEMRYRNVVSWTALIAGYVLCNKFKDALLVFQDMMLDNIVPNKYTLTSILTASAHLGALDQGRWIRQYIDKNKLGLNSALGTALVDMYAKCGCIDEALLVFEKLPVKDVYTYTAIITGLALNGDALRALKLFSRMLRDGFQPNEITFIGVLSACSHGGFVDEGRRLCQLMINVYHLEPNVDHYGCMVDLLGRAGYLEDAKKMIDEMPMKPSPGVLGALFGACLIHKAFEMGEYMGNCLINLQPNHSGRYVLLLANLYSICQKWEAAAHIRKLMKDKGMQKTPGYSWIEVNSSIHEFKAFDHSHSRSSNVYETLQNIIVQLKLAGQVQEGEDTNMFVSIMDDC